MKKAFLLMLFLFSAVIVGCGGDDAAAPVEGDPAMDAVDTEMETESPSDPGAEGEGEATTNATS